VIRSDHADQISGALTAAEIGNRAYYRRPIHHHPAMAPYAPAVELPATDQLARTHLAIPMSPVLRSADALQVTRCIEGAIAGRAA
jgi:dTDP-4-amino-4,6-dideoxygalactose transaminase